jgi:hypothetical protein
MELNLQNLFGLYSLAETLPPPPAFGLIYEGAIGQSKKTTSLCNPLVQAALYIEMRERAYIVKFLCLLSRVRAPVLNCTFQISD